MSFPKINPTETNAWNKLQQHFETIRDVKMPDLFAEDVSRTERFTFEWDAFKVDLSKNRITSESLSLLLQLAEETQLRAAMEAQFSGQPINETEDRAVLHTELRNFTSMKPEVAESLAQMKAFSEKVISGAWKGHTGKPITDVVNVGIGGSDLGPDMVTEALTFYRNHLHLHYISNVDGDHVMDTLQKLDHETTLFLIVSKTFTTQETLTNANTIREWFLEKASESAIAAHFVAVSTNGKAVEEFGIAPENMFPMWNWVGGRFSLWSAVGLSTCCAIGYKNFESLLNGAHAMDIHFQKTDFSKNIPVLLGLLSVWYNNFFKTETEAVLPYSQYLNKLVPYLQQAVMESNGKGVDRNGKTVTYETGTIVWGSTGTNAQHAFFQLLHQGTKLIPSDFIIFTESLHGKIDHQDKLLSNFYAQTEALLYGTKGEKMESPYKIFNGNRPSNSIVIKKLTPFSLGSLLALYEHKIFVQGVVWNIYSYDQWGVELGKKLAASKLALLQNK